MWVAGLTFSLYFLLQTVLLFPEQEEMFLPLQDESPT